MGGFCFMKTKIREFLVALVTLGMVFQPAFVTAGVPEAVTYLQGQNDNPWITMALAAAGQTNIPTGHLNNVSGTLATDYAKTILALAAVDENPSTFSNVDYVAQLKSYYNGTQIGDVNLLNDDAWAILALASVGEIGSVEVGSAKNFLLSHQNEDGGWSYSVGAGSDTNDTAAIVMALVAAGVATNNLVITKALTYLQLAQNSDGGFGYQIGNSSDSGSDSWVISALYKAGINPASWTKGANNPISHLESLQDDDGGFWWVTQGTSEWNNKAMTAFAVIALAGKSYPVGYYQPSGNSTPGTYHLRIEGQNATICAADITATTALDIVENAATICGYTYVIQDTTFGPYLSQINSEAAAGTSGWLYFVNNISPTSGAADYVLQEDDKVLWYYGDWGWNPTRVILDKTEVDPGEIISVNAQYFNGSEWLPLPNVTIKVSGESKTADGAGHLNLSIVNNGIYQVYIDNSGFVRSEKTTVTVGDTVSQNVGLQVEIDQSNSGRIGGEAIALVVTPSRLDFGKLEPGESASRDLTLHNQGTVNLNLGSSVSGDVVFTSGIKINGQSYTGYADTLNMAESKNTAISLTVPELYLASGIKTGELIIWATAQ